MRWTHTRLPRGLTRPPTIDAAVLAYLRASETPRPATATTAWLALYGISESAAMLALHRLADRGLLTRVSRTHWRCADA